jgi:hypothetical protein
VDLLEVREQAIGKRVWTARYFLRPWRQDACGYVRCGGHLGGESRAGRFEP